MNQAIFKQKCQIYDGFSFPIELLLLFFVYIKENWISLDFELLVGKNNVNLMTSPWAPGSYDGHFNTIFWYFIDQTINWLILKNNQKINQQWNLSFNASLDIQYPALLIVESIPFVIGFLNIKMWTLWFFCAVACTSLVIAQHRCYLLKPFGKNWNLDVVTPLELDTCSLLLTAGVYIPTNSLKQSHVPMPLRDTWKKRLLHN